MDSLLNNGKKQKIHFIGIGGVSTSALAKHLLSKEITVSGSDINYNEYCFELENRGVKVYKHHKRNNLKGTTAVVYTGAINGKNIELKSAIAKGLPVIKRSQLLGAISNEYKNSVAVSGCHGKTTTTAMIANVLISAGVDPTVFLGGDSHFGNYRLGKSQYAVLEACEYQKNFLDIPAKIKVVLNVDYDHPDTYENVEQTLNAFSQFIEDSIAVINADDIYSSQLFNDKTVTYGVEKLSTYMAKNISQGQNGYSFTVYKHGEKTCKINLNVLGKHNVYCALATFATCDLLGVPKNFIKIGLESFNGVKRRMEQIGEWCGKNAYADYAHHPKEITASISAFKEKEENFITVFQPHTYTRTKTLINEFVGALKDCTPLIIYNTFSARERALKGGKAIDLYEKLKGKTVYYAKNLKQLHKIVEQLNGKKIIFLGAGDLYQKIKKQINGKI